MPQTGEEDGELAVVRRLLKDVLLGREDPEGFFVMCLSILGHQGTRARFLPVVQPLSSANRSLHSTLVSIYEEYFAKVCNVVLGCLTNHYDAETIYFF